ncbi:MAG TPA: YbjQ family protein [Gemmatimonadaceae bacterium]
MPKLAMPPRPLPDFAATTSIALDGYDVVQTFGVVSGIVVRSRSVLGTLGAVFQTLRGGDISLLTELCERTRADAYANMVSHAQALGANAVIAVRYDASEIMAGVSEVLCYGTAVRVAPRLSNRQASV